MYLFIFNRSVNKREAIKSLWKGVWGRTFLQKGFPHVSSVSDPLERRARPFSSDSDLSSVSDPLERYFPAIETAFAWFSRAIICAIFSRTRSGT